MRCATTTMFSSPVPGSRPQIVAVFRSGTIFTSSASLTRGAGPPAAFAISSLRTAEPIILPEREGRHRALHRVELEVQVARDHQRDEDRGCALLADPLPRHRCDARRVARHVVVAVEEDRLPLQILTRQIGVGGQTRRQPPRARCRPADVATPRWRRLRAAERHALVTARRGDAPGLRHPLRRQIERLLADVSMRPEGLQPGHRSATGRFPHPPRLPMICPQNCGWPLSR